MKVLNVPNAGVELAAQDSPFLPGSSVVAYGAATNVLEGSDDGGSTWETIHTFSAAELFVNVNLGIYTHVRASSSDYVYLLNN